MSKAELLNNLKPIKPFKVVSYSNEVRRINYDAILQRIAGREKPRGKDTSVLSEL